MKFHIIIRTKGGVQEERTIEAASRFAVYDEVQSEGGSVLKIDEVARYFKRPAWLDVSIGAPVKRSTVTRFAKNLAAMLGAGLSLPRALSIIERQASNKRLRAIVAGMDDIIKKGGSFHEALAGYPRVFSGLFVAMARAGEESGTLADSLAMSSLQMERTEELIRKVKGAMIYPAIVIVAIIIVAVLMLIFVVPTLTATFASLGVKVPLSTRAIIAVSNFMQAHAILVLIGLVGAAVGGVLFVKSRPGSALVVAVALRVPVIGELVRETYAARTARTLSSLLTSGVPVLEALTITKDTVRAQVFARVITEAEARVKKGEPLSVSFEEHPELYPILMSDMIAVGEETGKVAEMLKQIAEFYEADVGDKTKDLSTIIEPILMLLIGAVVGVFAVSMIAPIYSLSSAI
jgi:type IV pilus assembly protein PilC